MLTATVSDGLLHCSDGKKWNLAHLLTYSRSGDKVSVRFIDHNWFDVQVDTAFEQYFKDANPTTTTVNTTEAKPIKLL